MTTEGNSTNKEPKKKTPIALILLLLLLLIAAIGAGIFFYLKSQQPQKGRLARDEDALGGMLPGKTEAEIQDLLAQKVEEGMVDVSIKGQPVFEYNGKKGLLGIENLETNHYSFQVDVLLNDTGDIIYHSGLIDPGYYIEYVELDKELEAGQYEATAVFTTYSLDESEDKIGQVQIGLNLTVTDGQYYQ